MAIDRSKPHVEATISADGVELQVKNMSGPTCLAATAELEKAIGGKIDRELLPSYEATTVTQNVQAQAG